MRPSRLPSLLLAVLVFLHGLAFGAAPGHGLSVPVSPTATAVGEQQHSVPLPQHDETTCAICHASVTLTPLALARSVIPDPPTSAWRAAPLSNDRLPRSAAERPASTRAPPSLRSA